MILKLMETCSPTGSRRESSHIYKLTYKNITGSLKIYFWFQMGSEWKVHFGAWKYNQGNENTFRGMKIHSGEWKYIQGNENTFRGMKIHSGEWKYIQGNENTFRGM